MKRLAWLILSVPLIAGAALAPGEKVYISDRLYLGLYASPGGNDRVALLSSGNALDVIEIQGEYVHVKAADGTEGWVRGSYLTTDIPASVSLPAAQKTNDTLTRQLADAQAKLAQFDQSSAPATSQDAGLAEKLRQQNSQLQDALSAANKRIASLSDQLDQAHEAHPRSTSAEPDPDPAALASLRARNGKLEQALSAADQKLEDLQKPAAVGPPGLMMNTETSLPVWLGLALVALVLGFFVGANWYRRKLEARFGGLRPR